MVHACKSNREEDHRTTGGQPSGSLQPPGPGGSIFLLPSLALRWLKATGNHTKWGEKKGRTIHGAVGHAGCVPGNYRQLTLGTVSLTATAKQFQFQFGIRARASSEEREYALIRIGV